MNTFITYICGIISALLIFDGVLAVPLSTYYLQHQRKYGKALLMLVIAATLVGIGYFFGCLTAKPSLIIQPTHHLATWIKIIVPIINVIIILIASKINWNFTTQKLGQLVKNVPASDNVKMYRIWLLKGQNKNAANQSKKLKSRSEK